MLSHKSPSPRDRPLRLFVALWPSPALRRTLSAHQQAWHWSEAAVRVAPERLHLTLHFLGDMPRERVDDLQGGLHVEFARFDLEFSAAAIWPRGTAVLLPNALPPALQTLHARLRDTLRSLRMPTQSSAFRPHVTLARRAERARPPEKVEPLRWSVRGYALVSSEPGPPARYRVLARYASSGQRRG